MNTVLKWGIIGISVVAVIATVIYIISLQTPIEQRTDLKWQTPVDVHLDLPPMPQMPSRDDVLGLPLPDALEKEAVKKTPDVAPSIPYEMEEGTPPPPPEDEIKKTPPPVVKSPTDPRPKIAIIIDDMGLNHSLSVRATHLPKAMTLAYLPYAPNLKAQTAAAAKIGHDLMLHFPMEPMGKQNPGPNALRNKQTTDEWEKLIETNLNSFDQFVGVNNHMGSKFTTNGKGLAFVAHALSKRGLFFVDSRTIAGSVAAKVMKVMNVKAASRDVFLDHVIKEDVIRKELARAEQIARRKGHVIVIGHPHKETLNVLENWAKEPSYKEFKLVPVSELVK